MADETPPPRQPDRRRPAPTIDLAATEIASDPATAAANGPEPAAPAPEPLQPEQDTAPKMPPRSAVHRSLSGLAAAVSWPLVGSGLAAAILTLGIAWVMAFSLGQGNESSAIDGRIAQLERQIAELAGRAGQDAASSASASDLANRMQSLEAQINRMAAARAPAAEPALANRIAAIETQLKSFNETVGALGRRSESTAAANATALSELNEKLARVGTPEPNSASNEASGANTALIAALANRVDALEGSAKATERTLAAALAKRQKEDADDRSVRTAVVAAALAAAVEGGEPFTAALAAARAQAADAGRLAPLEAFAAAGVPAAAVLARELSSLEPALLQAAGTAPSGGFLEKLQGHAERLVRIRPIEEVAGDDPAAVIARVEIKAGRGDLSGALLELGKLPPPVRAPAQAWIAKADARAAALAASRAFAAEALAALAQPSR
jgi:hypothetical protein